MANKRSDAILLGKKRSENSSEFLSLLEERSAAEKKVEGKKSFSAERDVSSFINFQVHNLEAANWSIIHWFSLWTFLFWFRFKWPFALVVEACILTSPSLICLISFTWNTITLEQMGTGRTVCSPQKSSSWLLPCCYKIPLKKAEACL